MYFDAAGKASALRSRHDPGGDANSDPPPRRRPSSAPPGRTGRYPPSHIPLRSHDAALYDPTAGRMAKALLEGCEATFAQVDAVVRAAEQTSSPHGGRRCAASPGLEHSQRAAGVASRAVERSHHASGEVRSSLHHPPMWKAPPRSREGMRNEMASRSTRRELVPWRVTCMCMCAHVWRRSILAFRVRGREAAG